MMFDTKREYPAVHFLVAYASDGMILRKVFSENEFEFSKAYFHEKNNILNAQGIKEIENKLRENSERSDVKFLALTNLGISSSSDFQFD